MTLRNAWLLGPEFYNSDSPNPKDWLISLLSILSSITYGMPESKEVFNSPDISALLFLSLILLNYDIIF